MNISHDAIEGGKLICLTSARDRYRPKECQHLHVEVDEKLAAVKCLDCGEMLNPVSVLARMASEETRWNRSMQELKKLSDSIDARSRCKCEHCGKMTRIRNLRPVP